MHLYDVTDHVICTLYVVYISIQLLSWSNTHDNKGKMNNLQKVEHIKKTMYADYLRITENNITVFNIRFRSIICYAWLMNSYWRSLKYLQKTTFINMCKIFGWWATILIQSCQINREQERESERERKRQRENNSHYECIDFILVVIFIIADSYPKILIVTKTLTNF